MNTNKKCLLSVITYYLIAILFGYIVFSAFQPSIFPKLDFNNYFEIASENPEIENVFVLSKDPNSEQFFEVSSSVKRDESNNTLSFTIPADYSFGVVVLNKNSIPLNISSVKVNGNEILPNKLSQIFGDAALITGGSSLQMSWAPSQTPIFISELEEVKKLTQAQISEIVDDDRFLSYQFMAFCIFLSCLCFLILQRVCRFDMFVGFPIKTLVCTVVLCIAVNFAFYLQLHSYIEGLNHYDFYGNLYKFVQNYLPVLFSVFCLLLYSVISKKLKIKIGLFVLFFGLIFIFLVDSFVQNILGARFLFGIATKHMVAPGQAFLFIKKYLISEAGIIFVTALILSVLLFIGTFKFANTNNEKSLLKFNSLIAITLVALVVFANVTLYEPLFGDFKFKNVFQANNITTENLGNYTRPYEKQYAPRDNLDFKWTTKKGLGLKKNVIIVLVESLNCEHTFVCGHEKELMPNLTKLAKAGLSFNNYYSNTYATALAYLSIVKGMPVFPKKNSNVKEISEYAQQMFKENDLLENFNKEGYVRRFISSTDLVFNFDEYLTFSNYNQIIDSSDKQFVNEKEKYLFNSVSDEVLFNRIHQMTTQENGNYIYITKTVSSHSPFLSPWGNNDFDKSFLYTDKVLSDFVVKLQNSGFFDNGLLVITGDHSPWAETNISSSEDPMKNNRVPLVILGSGVGQLSNGVDTDTYFSHASLGVFLSSMMLDNYKFNKFNADVLNSNAPETILFYEFDKFNFAIVKKGTEQAEIQIDGNNSMVKSGGFVKSFMDDVFGFMAWCGL